MSRKTYIIEEEFTTPEGYPAMITFTRLGSRCGYLLLSENSPLAGKPYYEWDNSDEDPIQQSINSLQVHGGLTYSSEGNESLFKRHGWVFGFDAGHFNDGADIEAILRYNLDRSIALTLTMAAMPDTTNGNIIRTKEFMKGELLKLSKQIKNIEQEFKN